MTELSQGTDDGEGFVADRDTGPVYGYTPEQEAEMAERAAQSGGAAPTGRELAQTPGRTLRADGAVFEHVKGRGDVPTHTKLVSRGNRTAADFYANNPNLAENISKGE